MSFGDNNNNNKNMVFGLISELIIVGLTFGGMLPVQVEMAKSQASKVQQMRNTLGTARTVGIAPMTAHSDTATTTTTPSNFSRSRNDNYKFSMDEVRLHDYIMRDYRETVRPAKYANETVGVITRIFPMKIQEIVEKDEILHISLRLQFGWVDKRLRWKPEEFAGLKTIILPGHAVWIPDIQFVNSADDMYALLGSRQFAVKIHNNGEVWYHPTGSLKLRCELDLQLFPYDHQRCKIILESVIYTHEQLNLTVRQDKSVSFSMYRDNGLWDVTSGYGSVMLNWATSTTAFSRVEFVLHMQRRTSYYVNNYIIPCFLLSCLQVLTFLIPLRNPERLTHATSVLLSLIVFQTIIFSELPKTAAAMPLLARYLMALSIVSVMAIASCVAVSYLLSLADKDASKNGTIQVPTLLVKMLHLRVIDPTYLAAIRTGGRRSNNNNNNNSNNSHYECSSLAADATSGTANPVDNDISNGRIISRHHQHHRVMRLSNNNNNNQQQQQSTYASSSSSSPKKERPSHLQKETVRAVQFYRRLAEQIDILALFICSVAVLCVPIALFIVVPTVTVPDPQHY